MNYRFENTYTRAEGIKWQMQARSELGMGAMSLTSSCLVFIIQFCLWAPVLYVSSKLALPFALEAFLLFVSFYLIGVFYDAMILPHVSARFDRNNEPNDGEKSQAIIDIDEEEIRTRENDREVIFKWSAIQSVTDNEKTVFLLTGSGYCAIPARCFSGFLEKDAFVRACQDRISGYTDQGAHFA